MTRRFSLTSEILIPVIDNITVYISSRQWTAVYNAPFHVKYNSIIKRGEKLILEDRRKLLSNKLSVWSTGKIERGNRIRLARTQRTNRENIGEKPCFKLAEKYSNLFFGKSCWQLLIRRSFPGESSASYEQIFSFARETCEFSSKRNTFPETSLSICNFLPVFRKKIKSR